jgi:4-amino-4-deoxy-L-arabinose transferase-like glycosyltransferase
LRLSASAQALLLFLLVAVAIRFISFFPSVIDHDESTYLVIADALYQGYTYQVDYIDTKPIGIFLIFAGLKPLLGDSVFWYRFFAALTLAFTAFLLYKAKRQDGSPHAAGIAAGVIYLALNSLYTRYGVSPNTETYFNLFTALALWIYLQKGPLWQYFLAGLSLGIGFVIKYVVVFDGLALGLFLLWRALRKEEGVVLAFGRAVTMAVGAAVPFAFLIGYYYERGQFDTFWFHSFTVAGRYPSTRTLWHYFEFFFEFFLRYLPITLLFIVVLRSRSLSPSTRQLGVIWSVFTLVAVLLPGNGFGHYYIQFMLPFSFLAGEFFALPISDIPRWLRWVRNPKIGYPLLALLLLTHFFLQKKDYLDRPDNVRKAAQYLNEHLEEGDLIYTQEDQAIYHLTGRLPLTKYVHPSLFWMDKHIEAMEIDVGEEVRKITSARPRFLVFRLPVEQERFAAFRSRYYEPVKNVGGYVQIFERRDNN